MWAPELNSLTLTSLALAFGAAIAGSMHCVGMCGPLRMLALGSRFSRWQYQGGRLLSYLVFGLGAGYLGATLPLWATIGLLLVTILLSLPQLPRFARWEKFRAHWLALSSRHPFFLGLSSGLLPCGFLHLWVAAAAASGNPIHGALLLSILWLGTLPALELSAGILQAFLQPLRRRFPLAVPLLLLLVAALPLISRTSGKHSTHQSGTQENHPDSCH